MILTEQRLRQLLQDLTPEPPRPLTVTDLTPPAGSRTRWPWLVPIAAAMVAAVIIVGTVLLLRPHPSRLAAPELHHSAPPPSPAAVVFCNAAELAPSIVRRGSVVNQPFTVIALKNLSSHVCAVEGYPTISSLGTPLDQAGVTVAALPIRVKNGGLYEVPDPGMHRITLAPGRAASFAIGTNLATNGGAHTYSITQIQIALPRGQGSLSVTLDMGASYAVGQPAVVGVTAFEAAITGAVTPPLNTTQSATAVLGGALLRLPDQWVARPLTSPWPTLCLAPVAAAVPARLGDCPILFRAVVPIAKRPLDANDPAGWSDDLCGQPPTSRTLTGFGTLPFGGRTAKVRDWTLVCGATTMQGRQYVLDISPEFVLVSTRTDAGTAAVLRQLAATASLPAQTAALPYSVTGTIESFSHQADGYHVTLRPAYTESEEVLHVPGEPTSQYLISNALVPSAALISQHSEITLSTDGTRVTNLAVDG